MKKNILISIFILLAILIVLVIFFMYNQKRSGGYSDLSKVSDSQVVSLLNKNPDAKDYLKVHPDYIIEDKIILTKESILAQRSGANFKEVYQGLEFQDNRYMRIDLINSAGDRGLVSVLDFKNNTVPKAYGIILLKVSQSQIQNGPTTSQTANK